MRALSVRALGRVLVRSYVLLSKARLSEAAVENVASKVESAEQSVVAESLSKQATDLDLLKKINDESLEMMRELSRLSEARAKQMLENVGLDKTSKLEEELQAFFKDFVGSKEKFLANKRRSANALNVAYPFLRRSVKSEPYTPQELVLRRKQHAEECGLYGSIVEDVYHPHEDLSNPPDYKELTIERLMAAGAHLGAATSLWRPSCQPYIYGEYKGIHIIDPEQTLTHLRRAAKVVEGVAEKGGLILFVGTREGHHRAVESAARRCNGYYNLHRWVPGTITNSTEIARNTEKEELDMADVPTGRPLSEFENSAVSKPDLIVFLNPTEHRTALREAMQTRVPTIGIIDTDSEPSFVTYPIPANDDSIRAVNVITGVLGRAGQVGRERRLQAMKNYNVNSE